MCPRSKSDTDTLKAAFLQKLQTNFVVASVCQKLRIHRDTYYKWRKNDSSFAIKADSALISAREQMNDVAESTLCQKIKEGNLGAVKYYLRHNHERYGGKKSQKTGQKNLSSEEISSIENILKPTKQ